MRNNRIFILIVDRTLHFWTIMCPVVALRFGGRWMEDIQHPLFTMYQMVTSCNLQPTIKRMEPLFLPQPPPQPASSSAKLVGFEYHMVQYGMNGSLQQIKLKFITSEGIDLIDLDILSRQVLTELSNFLRCLTTITYTPTTVKFSSASSLSSIQYGQ